MSIKSTRLSLDIFSEKRDKLLRKKVNPESIIKLRQYALMPLFINFGLHYIPGYSQLDLSSVFEIC